MSASVSFLADGPLMHNDVPLGEAIAFFAEPGSAGVTGQVLRVCGQSQIGA